MDQNENSPTTFNIEHQYQISPQPSESFRIWNTGRETVNITFHYELAPCALLVQITHEESTRQIPFMMFVCGTGICCSPHQHLNSTRRNASKFAEEAEVSHWLPDVIINTVDS
jgi:hypothetical protein